MRFTLAVLISFLAFSSCKVASYSSKEKRTIKEHIVVNDSLSFNLNEKIDWSELITSNTTIVIEKVEYDTEKPISDITKAPPIKRKETTKIGNETNVDKKGSSGTSIDGVNVVETNSSSDLKEDVAIKDTLNKANPLKYLSSILWALFALSILFIGYKLYHKLRI